MSELFSYKCNQCGRLHHPRYVVCQDPACGGREFTEAPLSGRAKLLTWTRVFNLPEGYMKPWLNFGIVEFENGLRATGQIAFDDIENGMDVTATVDVVKEGTTDKYGYIFVK